MINSSLHFENVLKDVSVNEASFRYEMANTTPSTRNYVIVFSARSGSTWLTSVLSGTNQLGYPEEYINPDFIREVAEFLNTRQPDDFLEILKRRRKSENGVFGMEARAVDVALFGEESFFRAFDNTTVFFNLWRENIVAQAISLYRAVATGRFHSNDGKENAGPPPYDAEAIKHWLAHLVEEENANVAMLQRRERPFRNLRYETIVRDRVGTMNLFMEALGVTSDPEKFTAAPEGELRKIGDSWNAETEQRFRAERDGFLARMEASRAIRKLESAE